MVTTFFNTKIKTKHNGNKSKKQGFSQTLAGFLKNGHL
jgi:hypothetical protein